MLKTDAGGGISSANSPNKTWEMVGSTIGGSTCYDFTGSGKSIFTEQENVSGEKYISWSGTEDGTIELATTFFTPKGSAYRIQSESTSTTLNSVESLVNAETVELKLFDSRGINDYDALEGLFDMLKDEKVCMSVDSSDEMKIWWNPEYLDEEINRVDYTTPSCG